MNPVLALIIANLIWGAASPVFKFALQNIPPFTLAFLRFYIAALLLTYVAMKSWKPLSRKQLVQICIGAFFATTLNISFYFLALPKTASINAPIIASAQPIFLYLFAIFLLHERQHARVLWGILISFIGVMVIILSPFLLTNGISIGAKELALEGNLYLCIATFAAVMQAILYKKILKTVNVYQATFITFLFGAISFIPFMYGELGSWSFSQLDVRGWTGIVFGGVLSSAIAYSLFNYGISKIDAQEVGIFAYIDPVVAVLLAIPLLHEYPTVPFYLGSFFVFIGIIIAEGRLHWHPLHKL